MPQRLTPEQLQEIEARHKALPEAPDWSIQSLQWTDSNGMEQLDYFKRINGEKLYVPAYSVTGINTVGDYECGAMEKPMAEFVFHARADIPALLAEIKALQKSEQRVIDLEDAITQAGLILSGPEDMPEVARHVIKRAMKSLGSGMNDPQTLKRQGI